MSRAENYQEALRWHAVEDDSGIGTVQLLTRALAEVGANRVGHGQRNDRNGLSRCIS